MQEYIRKATSQCTIHIDRGWNITALKSISPPREKQYPLDNIDIYGWTMPVASF